MKNRTEGISIKWHWHFLIVVLAIAILLSDFLTAKAWATQTQLSELMQDACSHLTSSIIWGAGSLLLIYFACRKWGFNIFQKQPKPTNNALVINIFLVVAITAILWLLVGGFKPYMEYLGARERVGDSAWILFITQNIYYVFEMMICLVIIIFAQMAMEALSCAKKVPWGGIVLGLSWGLAHIFSKDLPTGIFALIIGVLLGLPYITLNRNAKLAWLFMFLIFAL